MLLITSIIVSAIAALIGIFSKSWDKEKKGLAKLSISGWLLLTMALMGCTISIIITVQNERQKKAAYNDRQKVISTAHERIANVSIEMLLPIATILYKDKGMEQQFNPDTLPSVFARMLNSDSAMQFLENHEFKAIDSRSSTRSKFSRRLDIFDYNILTDYYHDNAEKLQKIREEWSPYLESADLLLIDSIVHHPFYDGIKSLDPPRNNMIAKPFSRRSFRIYYRSYIDQLTRLLSKVETKNSKMLGYDYFNDFWDIFGDM